MYTLVNSHNIISNDQNIINKRPVQIVSPVLQNCEIIFNLCVEKFKTQLSIDHFSFYMKLECDAIFDLHCAHLLEF